MTFSLEIFDNLLSLPYLASVDSFVESQRRILWCWRCESLLNVFDKTRIVITYILEIFSEVIKA